MSDTNPDPNRELVQGIDYYIENGRWVFTREYHLRRGNCCKSECRHCPYLEKGKPAAEPLGSLLPRGSDDCLPGQSS